MANYNRTNFTIGQIIRLWDRNQLILQPKFQRRAAWEEAARSYLIDTIVRKLPMPKIYLRRIIRSYRKKKYNAYEVVDGQQRLRAIIDYRKGNLILNETHNKDFGNMRFQDLPDPIQRTFIGYEISTEVIEEASDPEVWGMFERLNTYTLTLNRQERLNARFFGHFKQAAYQLAAEESALSTWKQLNIFGNRQIARMKEVEMTSDIMVAIIRGISDISGIPKAYKEFDDEFPMKDSVMSTFRNALSLVTELPLETVRNTRFRRLAWFYSLMLAIADAQTGIPNGYGPCNIEQEEELNRRMFLIDEALKQEQPSEGLKDLYDTLSRATSHVRERQIRHTYFFKMLTFSEEDWDSYWNQLRTA